MLSHAPSPARALDVSVKVWFASALIGQLIFAIYIGFRFGIPLYIGSPEDMNMSELITGYVPGDFSGNSMLLIHVFGAAILSASGMLQLVPVLRTRFPRWHRFNGRVFFSIGLIGAITGLYLTWLRGSRLSDIGAIGVSLNGILIVVAIYYAWRLAIERKYAQHLRVAIHAFLLVNAVWTVRLFLMGWFLTTQGLGTNSTLDGPANIIISFSSYLLPMALAELYFWGKKQSNTHRQWAIVGAMACGCTVTVIGVAAASLFLWLPGIGKAIAMM